MLLYWRLLPWLRSIFPDLTPFERHLILQWDNTPIPLTVLFALIVWAAIYQGRFKRTWVEAFFRGINIAFAIFLGLILLTVVLGIDFMPRQQ